MAVLVLTGSVAGTHLEMTQVRMRPWQCWYCQRRGDSLRDDAGRDAAVAVLVFTGSVAGTYLEMTQVGMRPWQCWYSLAASRELT